MNELCSTSSNDKDVDISSLHVQANTTLEDLTSLRGSSSLWGHSHVLPPKHNNDSFLLKEHSMTDNLDARAPKRRSFLHWWSNAVSRVSLAASSLLSQHSPNLNDLLDGSESNQLAADLAEERMCQSSTQSIQQGHNRIEPKEQELSLLREEVRTLKLKVQHLQQQLPQQTQPLCLSSNDWNHHQDLRVLENMPSTIIESENDIPLLSPRQTLHSDQISRYSRQLLLSDGFGVSGQKKLLSTSILVVGAGGIGSTVLLYLAAAGIGHITIVDYDNVETSNLHRQIIHKDRNSSKNIPTGMNKAHSAKQSLLALNPTVSVTALSVMINGENALDLVSRHEVVVDASDNPYTRYLLNDACIIAGKVLVSGSAMGTEGQLTVYNHHSHSTQSNPSPQPATACYRCMYPKPNPVEGRKSCSDNGVLGPVPGLIGVLQAVEVLKIVTGIGNVMHDRLLVYDSLNCSFLNLKKPPQKWNCAVCSSEATIKCLSDTEQSLREVRGPGTCSVTNPTENRMGQNISCIEYNYVRTSKKPHVLLDVRVKHQYEICSLEGSFNIPLTELEANIDLVAELSHGELPIFCLCRRGIASVEATRLIQTCIDGIYSKRIHSVFNIEGGLTSWVETVDSTFPQY